MPFSQPYSLAEDEIGKERTMSGSSTTSTPSFSSELIGPGRTKLSAYSSGGVWRWMLDVYAGFNGL